MTAVEYLIEQLMERGFQEKNYEILKQAKEMEKQQIIDAHISGYDSSGESAKDYYDFYYGSKGSDVTASQLKISDSCIPPESFTLSLDREEPPVIVIDKEGFKYKGELVEDKGEIYQLFKNYLISSQTENKGLDWLVSHWKKLKSEGEKMNWEQIIQITELAKDVPSSQTEISDEEIVSLANEHVLYNDSKRQWVIEGMKLYREQFKKK